MTRRTHRKYCVLDQLRVDLGSGIHTLVLYAVRIGSLVCGAVTMSWPSVLAGAALFFVFGRGFVNGIRTVRHGVLTTTRITALQHDVGRGQGVNENVELDGRTMNIRYDRPMLEALLAESGSAELQLVYDARQNRPSAQAVAYRRTVEP